MPGDNLEDVLDATGRLKSHYLFILICLSLLYLSVVADFLCESARKSHTGKSSDLEPTRLYEL